MQIVNLDYSGHLMSYQDDGWFNATAAAAHFGKVPAEWLRLDSTKAYIDALKSYYPDMGKTHIAKKGGTNGGGATWMHPKLAVAFARWLDVEFSVWCDSQIDNLINKKSDWRKMRHSAASSTKVANDLLKLIRESMGKTTESHHYSNEARLVNWALSGEFKGIDRDTLPLSDLDLLAHLEERNAILITRGLQYDKRKPMLQQYAFDWRMANQKRLGE